MNTNSANGFHSQSGNFSSNGENGHSGAPGHNGHNGHDGHDGHDGYDGTVKAHDMPSFQSTPVIEISDITKVYQMGDTQVRALDGVSLTVREGEYVAIIGASGSGKSTLMNMIGLLDRPSSGSYRIRGEEVSKLGESRLADLRNREIGFVFQRFNLLARTTARRQVELPLFYAGVNSGMAAQMALEALGKVGLAERAHHKPDELSGGQQQRVAIARALVNQPSLLLADEPTGALDSKTGEEIMELFHELHRQGMTVITVTHDMHVAGQAERIVTLKDGRIISDERNGHASSNRARAAELTPAPVLHGAPVRE